MILATLLLLELSPLNSRLLSYRTIYQNILERLHPLSQQFNEPLSFQNGREI